MSQVLYRKYRSKSLDEVIGQQHITKTLQHALTSGHIAHAYLFTGPRGVGKTSVARIVAHEVNHIPYTDDSNHLDIIEIDAASNRRIDEIRDLREKVNLLPTSAKYKVYIVDEVHMLTREAFNALLKTLEEPPEHVIFILATTEAYKLPETIVSRTQRFSFKPVAMNEVVLHLRFIAEKEKITIADEALQLIAEHGDGSFRDSISLLDQLRHQDNQISLTDVQAMLGIASVSAIKTLINAITNNDAKQLVGELAMLYEHGYQATSVAKQVAQLIREDIVNDRDLLPRNIALKLLHQLLDIPSAMQPENLLEIVLLSSLFDNKPVIAPTSTVIEDKKITEPLVIQEPPMVDVVVTTPVQIKNSSDNKSFNEALWPQILSTTKKVHNTLYSILRMSRPVFGTDSLELEFAFKFHQKRINEAKNLQIIADIVHDLTGKKVKITCTVTPGAIPLTNNVIEEHALEEVALQNQTSLDTINNIFGDSEVLES